MGVRGAKPEITTKREPITPEMISGGEAVEEFPAPADLTDDAAVLWNVLVEDLVSARVFRKGDEPLLSELVSSLAMAREFRFEVDTLQARLRQAYEDDDLEVADALSANLKRARTGYRQMMQTVMSIAGEFGISPVSRLRLGLMKIEGENSLLALADKVRDAGRS